MPARRLAPGLAAELVFGELATVDPEHHAAVSSLDGRAVIPVALAVLEPRCATVSSLDGWATVPVEVIVLVPQRA